MGSGIRLRGHGLERFIELCRDLKQHIHRADDQRGKGNGPWDMDGGAPDGQVAHRIDPAVIAHSQQEDGDQDIEDAVQDTLDLFGKQVIENIHFCVGIQVEDGTGSKVHRKNDDITGQFLRPGKGDGGHVAGDHLDKGERHGKHQT